MRVFSTIIALTFGLLLAAPVLAQNEVFNLDDVAFMEGHWVMEDGDSRAEEIWMMPKDGSMVGSFRWAMPGQMHVLEFLVMEQTDEGVTFRFKHYGKDHKAWEEQPNTYRITSASEGKVVLTNVDWNGRVPQTMIYEMTGPDTLQFRGESPGEESLILTFVKED